MDRVRALAARLDGPEPPSKHEIEEALERGFASLMTLEAQLHQAKAAASADPNQASAVPALKAQIDSLRTALNELRVSTSSSPASGLTPGFVLPEGL